MELSFEVVVIGAGACGLQAALELALTGKKVAVVEARDRVGGRIHTLNDPNFQLPVELGAEFIHGDLEPTKKLLEKANASYYEVFAEVWQQLDGQLQQQDHFIEDEDLLQQRFKQLKKDISVAAFLENYLQEDRYEEMRFTLKNYVEGYDAADIQKASTYALRDDLSVGDKKQFRLEAGYGSLIDYLYKACLQQNVLFFLSDPVKEIHWEEDRVTTHCEEHLFFSQKIIITVPVGLLQTESIRFFPVLTQKMAASRILGFGSVIKIIFQFHEPFWRNKNYTQGKDLSRAGFIFSSESIPTWWTCYPKEASVITGWCAGPHAEKLKHEDNALILQVAIHSLAQVFKLDQSFLKSHLKDSRVVNWASDPFSLGAYSYDVMGGGAAKKIISTPEKETVFFASEGLVQGPEIGTVNGALVSGRETARAMIAAFKK